MKQKKGRRLTIGFKMILIISLILMAALTGLSYITTFFFRKIQ